MIHKGSLSHWPPLRITLRVFGIAAFIWAACRATGWAVTIVAPPPFGPPLMVAVVVALVRLQLRRSNELVLFQNLAVRPVHVHLIAIVAAVALEVALWSVLIEASFWTWPTGTP